MPTPPARLFLSYGRADASALAERLVRDLAQPDANGQAPYAPWRDRVQLKAGASWAEQISAALHDTAVVLALMSPHSVRSRADGRAHDDSVCLDEISFARFAARKPIVPVLVAPCTPPFEIFRLDYVDFTQWQDEAAYQTALARLREALAAALRGEIRTRSAVERLLPWDFGRYLERKREGFVGRRWLFTALQRALTDKHRRAVLITGGPGFGKSAFVAEYLHRNPDGRVLAFHCCQADTRETLSPGRFVRSIAAMIAGRHPAYQALIEQAPYRDVLTEQACGADPASAFEEGVLAALQQVGPPQPGHWTLLVDALDEAAEATAMTGDTAPGIVQLLAERSARFPPWLTLVATSRPEHSVLALFANLKPLLIDPTALANVRDLRRLVADRLAQPPLAALVAASQHKAAWAAKKIGDAAEGNFLYAEQALEALSQRLLTMDELGSASLPPGLTRQYRLFFGRRFGTEAAWQAVQPLLAVLAAAQAPLAMAELSAATGLAVGAVLSQRLAALGAYVRQFAGLAPQVAPHMPLHAPPHPPSQPSAQPAPQPAPHQATRYALFHRSLLDWVTGADEQGGRFAIDIADGHRRLADGLHAAYQADRFQCSGYALAHLATHQAAACAQPGTPVVQRAQRQRALADFVLDPVVQAQRLADPFGLDASLRLALQTVAAGPPEQAAPVAIRLALGLEAFRRERLDASRFLDLAAAGELAQAERELQLYPADEPWLNAARLLMAWLAITSDRAGAGELRARSHTGTALDARVAAAFEHRDAVLVPLPGPVGLDEVTQILLQAGGSDAEGASPSMAVEQTAPPGAGHAGDAEGPRFMAEFQAPVLVAFALREPVLGSAKLREYIALNGANAYRVYRNGSLWQILLAVARHPDPAWVRELARTVLCAAFAGRGREFGGAAAIALATLRARNGGAAERQALDAQRAAALAATDQLHPLRGQGDDWGDHRRTLAAHAVARHVLMGEDVRPLLGRTLALPPGYAGFHSATCIDLAAALALCGMNERVAEALNQAERAAHNVQDLVFCARSTSRVLVMAQRWWPAAAGDAISVMASVGQLAAEPSAAAFSSLHRVGERYGYRRFAGPNGALPAWLLQARSLQALARATQWRLAEWQRVNPVIDAADSLLSDGTLVQVPDPRFAPHLAVWLGHRVLASAVLTQRERSQAMLRLLPVAVSDRTELDNLIACLLLAAAPAAAAALDEIEAALAAYPLPAMAASAGPEPLA